MMWTLFLGFRSDRDYPHSKKTVPVERDSYQSSFFPHVCIFSAYLIIFKFGRWYRYSASEIIRSKEEKKEKQALLKK